MYGGWHNKRWIYAISAKPPFDPYSPPWPPPHANPCPLATRGPASGAKTLRVGCPRPTFARGTTLLPSLRHGGGCSGSHVHVKNS